MLQLKSFFSHRILRNVVGAWFGVCFFAILACVPGNSYVWGKNIAQQQPKLVKRSHYSKPVSHHSKPVLWVGPDMDPAWTKGLSPQAFDALPVTLAAFPCGELTVDIKAPVRGRPVVLVQSIMDHENLVRVLFLCRKLVQQGVEQITLIAPFLFYGRQASEKQGLFGDVLAMLRWAGVKQVFTLDTHVSPSLLGQQDFLHVLDPTPVWAKTVSADMQNNPTHRRENVVIVAPDRGSLPRAKALANRLGLPFCVLGKKRTQQGIMVTLPPVDFKNKACYLIDDIVDSGSTLRKAADAMRQAGAAVVKACITHGVLSYAQEFLQNTHLDAVFLGDTVPLNVDLLHIQRVHMMPLLDNTLHALQYPRKTF